MGTQNKGKMTNREILLEMYEKLWNADKDKWAWNVILKDTLEKLEKCKHIKREGNRILKRMEQIRNNLCS